MSEDPSVLSDGLTAAVLESQLSVPKVQSWFKALDVDAKQAWKLYKILDHDRSGHVSIEEFVEGCLRLRGQATRVDVESMKWEIRGSTKRAEQNAQRLTQLIENLGNTRVACTLKPSRPEPAQREIQPERLPSPLCL